MAACLLTTDAYIRRNTEFSIKHIKQVCMSDTDGSAKPKGGQAATGDQAGNGSGRDTQILRDLCKRQQVF